MSEGGREHLAGGMVSEGTRMGPSLDSELFPPLHPNGFSMQSSDLESSNRELLVVAALEVLAPVRAVRCQGPCKAACS